MGKVLYNIYIYLNSREEKYMEEKRLLSKDEVYFLVFFSNSFIGSIILSGRYHFDSECIRRDTKEPYGIQGLETQIVIKENNEWKLMHIHYSK